MAEPVNMRWAEVPFDSQVKEQKEPTLPKDGRVLFTVLQMLDRIEEMSPIDPIEWNYTVDKIQELNEEGRQKVARQIAWTVRGVFQHPKSVERGCEHEEKELASMINGVGISDKTSSEPVINQCQKDNLDLFARSPELQTLLPYFSPLPTAASFDSWYDRLRHSVVPDILECIREGNILSEVEKAEFLKYSPETIVSDPALLTLVLQAGYDISLVGITVTQFWRDGEFINSLTSLPLPQKVEAIRKYLDKNSPSITQLFIAAWHICCLPKEFCLPGLQVLDLSINYIHVLPPQIGDLCDLVYLNLWNNKLDSLPREIGKLVLLTELYLNHNNLDSLPPEIGELVLLKRLSVAQNKLKSLPQELVNLCKLEWFKAGYNQLTSLWPDKANFSQLELLNVSENQLTQLPLGNLGSLRRLYINSNQLKSLPKELFTLDVLQTLAIAKNPLTSLPPELCNLFAKVKVYMSADQLALLPEELPNLPRLY